MIIYYKNKPLLELEGSGFSVKIMNTNVKITDLGPDKPKPRELPEYVKHDMACSSLERAVSHRMLGGTPSKNDL